MDPHRLSGPGESNGAWICKRDGGADGNGAQSNRGLCGKGAGLLAVLVLHGDVHREGCCLGSCGA